MENEQLTECERVWKDIQSYFQELIKQNDNQQ